MKYCLDVRTADGHFPGIGRYTAGLARALAEQLENGEELILIRSSRTPAGKGTEWPISQKVRVVETGAGVFSLTQQIAIPRLLRRIGAEVYHSPYLVMPYRLPARTVVTLHDLIPLRHPELVTSVARWFFPAALRLALSAADRVLFVSETVRTDFLKRTSRPESITAVAAPGVDPHFAPPPAEVIEAMRRRLGLPEKYVLFLGNERPHKNLNTLLAAWARLETDAILVAAGRVKSRWTPARVLYPGRISESDLPPLYSGATLFVCPSLDEGFGLPVLEAMACGAPVAASRAGSLPEVAGPAGALFDPDNPDGLARVLSDLLERPDRLKELRDLGLRRVREFSWEKCAAKVLAVYRELARLK